MTRVTRMNRMTGMTEMTRMIGMTLINVLLGFGSLSTWHPRRGSTPVSTEMTGMTQGVLLTSFLSKISVFVLDYECLA